MPDVAPVTFRIDEEERLVIDGFDNPRTIKWRNVVATGRAAFVIDDLASVEPWTPRGVKIRGQAEARDDGTRRSIVVTPATIWSWGINVGAATHFAGRIERREVGTA